MKTKYKNYSFGPMTFKCYYRAAGNGYEVGVTYKGQSFFMGNFVHAREAATWWKKMNFEMSKFVRSFEYYPSASATWYTKFFSSKLYASYYAWLDTCFTKYTKSYKKAFDSNFKTYRKYEKHFDRYAA